ncbi:uncharacterized protein VNE69_01128 [Vairimorpha necatrix]|uniref:Membrane protein n=1 Tax=Vairimorpha necatrix TaxID=6039 RepID=A0AAX4J872_9MICR
MPEFFDKFLKLFTDFASAVYTLLLILTIGLVIMGIYLITRPTESERFEQRLREERLLREEREREERERKEREKREKEGKEGKV